MLAVIDSQLHVTHPEASAGNLVAARPGPVTDEHGTAVAATAAAPVNGGGVVGLWPGLPTRVYASGLGCGELARAVAEATADGASAINMSFGGGGCRTLYVAVTGSAGSAVMDDMMFINGQVFSRRDAPSLSLRGRRWDSLRGSLDDWEDPTDVYWLAVPAHSNFDVRLRVQRGDADLFAYRRGVPTIMTSSGGVRRRGLISMSTRYGRRTETLYLRNPGSAGLLATCCQLGASAADGRR